MAFMRETQRSLRLYFVIVGLWLGGAAAVAISEGLGNATIMAVGAIGVISGLAYLYCGVALPRLLATDPKPITIILTIGMIISVSASGLSYLMGQGSIVSPVIQVLITIYLLNNVTRLAKERAAAAGP